MSITGYTDYQIGSESSYLWKQELVPDMCQSAHAWVINRTFFVEIGPHTATPLLQY